MKTATRVLLCLAGLLTVGAFNCPSDQEDVTVNDNDIKVVHFEQLNYPTFARAAHVEGVVVLRVFLDDRGDVVRAVAISGKEPLIPDTIANAKKWKFQPNAHKMAVIVYNFTMPTGACGTADTLFILQGANFATIMGCPPPVEPSESSR